MRHPRVSPSVDFRPTRTSDDEAIAELLDAAYVNTMDFDPEADHRDLLRTWRGVDHADDDVSVVGTVEERVVGACLVGHELDAPFLYEIAVAPDFKRRGLGRAMLDASVGALGAGGAETLSAWVTDANLPSEGLLANAGFVPTTRPLDRSFGVKHYRAAAAAKRLDRARVLAMETEVTEGGTTRLWVVAEDARDAATVRVGDTTVTVTWIRPDDSRVPSIARDGIPLVGAAWLLSHR